MASGGEQNVDTFAEEAGGHADGSEGEPLQYLKDRVTGKSRVFTRKEGGNGEYDYEYEYPDKPPVAVCYVPPFVLGCPSQLERNGCCYAVGSWGCLNDDDDDDNGESDGPCAGICPSCTGGRKSMLTFATCMNFIAGLFTLFANFSISKNYDLINAFPFSSGTVLTSVALASNSSESYEVREGTMSVGLTAIAVNNVGTYVGEHVISFDEFCDVRQVTNVTNETSAEDRQDNQDASTLGSFFDADAMCNQCSEESAGFVVPLIISMVTMFPTLTTDFLRIYKHYDVNCQKFSACVISAVSTVLTLTTFSSYQANCYDAFFQGTVTVSSLTTSAILRNSMATLYPDSDWARRGPTLGSAATDIVLKYDWSAGAGFVCLVLATIIRGMDVVFHCIIKTPSLSRKLDKQKMYELKASRSPPTDDA